MTFSLFFVEILIWGGLSWTLAGAICLLTLLVRDWKKKEIW